MRTTIGKIALLLVVLALIAAACGGDESPFGTAATTASGDGGNGDGGGTGTTAAGTETTAAAAETTEAPDSTDGAGGDIADLIARAENVPLRTTYRFGEPPDEQVITMVQDPTLDPPASALIMPEGKIVSRGDETIICDLGGMGQCFSMPGGEGADMMMQGFINPLLLSLLASGDVTDTPGYEVDETPTEIAGRRGICFTFTPQAFIGSDMEWIRQCIDAELGFTLLFEGRDRGEDAPQRIMELLEFGQPQPGDFEPSGPVTPMPGG